MSHTSHLRNGRTIAHTHTHGDRRALNIINPRSADTMDQQMTALPIPLPNRVVVRSDSTTSAAASTTSCSAGDNSSLCEKPQSSSIFTLPIILGITLPAIAAFLLFVYLHRRHVRKQREEDVNDRTNTMDFGLDHVPGLPGKRRFVEPEDEIDSKEKGRSGRPRQMSMDMAIVSPYLLPAELQNSRESLHSLSRTIHQNEDPYRPITHYLGDDGRSIRSTSKPRHDGSSIYTGSSGAPSRLQDISTTDLLKDVAKMPRSNPPTAGFMPPPRYNSLPLSDKTNSPISPTESAVDRKYPINRNSPVEPAKSPFEDEKNELENVQRKPLPFGGLPTTPRPNAEPTLPQPAELRHSNAGDDMAKMRNSNNYLGALINSYPSPSPSPEPIEVPKPVLLQTPNRKSPPPTLNSLPKSPRPPPRGDSQTMAMPAAPGDEEYDGFKVTPPSPGHENVMRGQRYSMDVPPEEFAQAGLGAPGFDPKRLSMGFRPLPPDNIAETEDPEMRANRIRSFYKEYFDDSKPAPQGQYYEDYDENYLGDMAYYDPDSNNFVMPYAEPVTRRAMTPPPRGPPRFMGPAGARPRMGSMGAMSASGPRAQSSASQMRPPPRGPKKPFVPPQALSTLPTPSKLRDDSFAIMGANEFAPPTSFRDRQLGRSESPLGERRPYSPSVQPHTPLVSAFDDLAPMPSPHLLRKSGTFTALDFAPPRKFRDQDNMSDAGSIRSARSGISAVQHDAVRKGAYRVSRLPPGMVGTKDDLVNSLRPQMNMNR